MLQGACALFTEQEQKRPRQTGDTGRAELCREGTPKFTRRAVRLARGRLPWTRGNFCIENWTSDLKMHSKITHSVPKAVLSTTSSEHRTRGGRHHGGRGDAPSA